MVLLLPTVEALVVACRADTTTTNDGNGAKDDGDLPPQSPTTATATATTDATLGMVQILRACLVVVIDAPDHSTSIVPQQQDTLVSRSASAIAILTSTLAAVLIPTECNDTESSSSSSTAFHTFAAALASAVGWVSCVSSANNSNNNAGLVAALRAVLDAAAEHHREDPTNNETNARNDANTATEPFSTSWAYTILARSLLRTVADCALLRAIGVLQNNEDLPKKLRIMNTTVNYRQYKFNLLSEESQGYSKLLYHLGHLPLLSSSTNDGTEDAATDMVWMLIGTYSLDPNRCLDLAVDVLEYDFLTGSSPFDETTDGSSSMRKNRESLGRVIAALNETAKLPALLGFKLRTRMIMPMATTTTIRTTSSAVPPATPTPTVASLLRCMVWLCMQPATTSLQPAASNSSDSANGRASESRFLLNARQMMPYLPDESGKASTHIDVAYQEKFQTEKDRIRSLGRVRLVGGGDVEDGDAAKTTNDGASLSSLKQLLILQWLEIFCQWQALESMESIFSTTEWSDLAFLFPTMVGCAILDRLQAQIVTNGWTEYQTPWSSDQNRMAIETGLPSVDQVLALVVDPLTCTMESGCIALNPALYCQVCRLFARLLRESKETNVNAGLVAFLKSVLVPSLSAFTPNPALSMELWAVLQEIPYHTRYNIYMKWRGQGLERASLETNKPLWLIEGELLMGKNARYALKRLSKDTIRDMSRAVAKCCYCHPLVVFTTILNQIESYDNMVQVMVDSCRFVTPLSLDVLGFCILQRLSSSSSEGSAVNRSSLKENGVNVSQWLQSLESFTGAFYKSFPHVEFQGILCYLMQRLKDGHVMELGVLRTLLKDCAGWNFADYAPAASLSSTQLEGRAGSTLLKSETMTFGIVSDINLVASNEVRRCLQRENIGVSLLILLAQVRHQLVFDSKSDRSVPVKLIGNLVDTSQVVMAILLDFLTNSDESTDLRIGFSDSAIGKYAVSLPPLIDLFNVYKLDVQSAWMLSRPLFRAAADKNDGNGLLNVYSSTDQFRESLHAMMPTSVWSLFSSELFECFFVNTLSDIYCPSDVYNAEVSRLDKEAERISQKRNAPTSQQDKSSRDELDRVQRKSTSLSSGCLKQQARIALTHSTLASKTDSFFISKEVSIDAAMTFFVSCVYPRCMQGPDDALYCGHFVSFLHQSSTGGFSTLLYYDSLIAILSRSLFCLTEGEAACASILLLETWKTISKWRYDEKAFETELMDRPGSAATLLSSKDGTKSRFQNVSRKDFENLYNKWHAKIGVSCEGCLQSSEYMHLRSCLVVLTRMVEVYPTRPKLANRLLKLLEPLQKESNPFADIRATAQAYSMQLLRSRDSGVWKEEDVATVEARQALVEAAAAERQKKAAVQMEQMKRDYDQITETIGDYDSRDRSRSRGAQFGDKGGQRFDSDERRTSEARRRAPLAPDIAEDGRSGTRQAPQARDVAQGLQTANPERWQRDRGNSHALIPGDSRHEDSISRGRSLEDAQNRNLDGRWQNANERKSPPRPTTGGRKRSRPSSPVDTGESQAEATAPKRTKASHDEDVRGDEDGPKRRTASTSGGSRRGRNDGSGVRR